MGKIINKDLVKIISKETGEEILFSTGTLTITNINQIKDWEVDINGIEGYGYLSKMFNGDPLTSEFVCKDGEILYGDTIMPNVNIGSKHISLKGTGPIRYKENDKMFLI